MSRFLLCIALLGGCKVVDAPDNLEELAVFAFTHQHEEDPAFLQAMHAELVPLVDQHLDEMEDGFRVNNLTSEDLEAAGVADADVSDIVGALGRAEYTSRIDPILQTVTDPNKDEIFETYLAYSVDEDTDLDCFLARDCEFYDLTVTQTTKIPLLGEATYTFDQSYRWVDLEGDESFVVMKTLAPDPIDFTTNIANIHQQYAVAIFLPQDDGGVRRVEGFWAEAEVIGLDVPDYFAVESAAKEMQEQADRVDEHISGG